VGIKIKVLLETHTDSPPSFLLLLPINQQILHSQEVHDKLAAMMSEEVGRQVNERLKQVRDDTTILKDQVSRETSFMSTFVAGGIQRIEDKVRLESSPSPSHPYPHPPFPLCVVAAANSPA